MKHGNYKSSADGWKKVLLGDIGFRSGEKADYIIIAGCLYPESIPNVFSIFKTLLDLWHVSYSLLPKENCCGYAIVQSALQSKNQGDIQLSKQLSKEFIEENFRQAEALGAKHIVLFCSRCEPLYSICAASTNLEIMTYADLIDRFFQGGQLSRDIDFYSGCYRFRNRFIRKALDLQSVQNILGRIEGLHINYLDNRLCCNVPAQLNQLSNSLKTRSLVTLCTLCHKNLRANLQEKAFVKVQLLPELVMDSILNR